MLPIRLPAIQLQLHAHRRWLFAFLQDTRISTFSTSARQHDYVKKEKRRIPAGHAERRSRVATGLSKDDRDGTSMIRKYAGRNPIQREDNPIITDIRQKALVGNISHVIENYTALNDRDKAELLSRDTRLIARCLHTALRKENAGRDPHKAIAIRQWVDFAEKLVDDVQADKLAPSGKAFVHLIGIFKESGAREKGVQFWKWLAEQDETYVDVDCYGAALELLAVDGKPLAELEQLYEDALRRFPGNFAAYHLSPDAVLSDREKPFMVGGIPISLLQGILTARLLHGDTRNAYLALDTALRIIPDQVPDRIFRLFLEERPVAEAYAVFALACRSGNNVNGAYYRGITSILKKHSSLDTPVQHALCIRAMLSATYMFTGTGGIVATNSVNEVVIATSQFLRLKGIAALAPDDKQKVVDAVMSLIRAIFEMFSRFGVTPGIPAFNSIITNLGGFGDSKSTIGTALKMADELALTPTDVTWRSVLAAGGMLRDKNLVEKTWGHLRDSRIETETNPSVSDFHALVKPAHLAGAVDFALDDLEKFRDVMDANEYETVLYRFEDANEAEVVDPSGNAPAVDVEEIVAEIEKIQADLQLIKERTEGNPAVQDFSEQALPLTLQPVSSSLDLSDTQLRTIYDSLTTTPTSSTDALDPTPSDAEFVGQEDSTQQLPLGQTLRIAKSKTNIPFGTLRYENWKMINLLLEMSENNDREYMRVVDAAIKAGTLAPKRIQGLAGADGKKILSWGLSSAVKDKAEGFQSQEGEEVGEQEVKEIKRKIERLRGRRSGP